MPTTSRRSKKPFIWGACVLVVLGILATGYWAYGRGLITIPFISPKADELFGKMIDSIGTIDEAQYTITGRLVAQPRAANAKPLFEKPTETANTNTNGSVSKSLLGVSDPADALRFLPADINVSGSLTFYGENAATVKDASGLVRLAGSYTGGDSTLQLDVEARKIKDTVYGIVRKFPSLFFFDFTALKDKWVEILPEQLSGSGFFDVDEIQNAKLKENIEKLRRPLELALEHEVVTVGKRFGNEDVAGVKAQHIRLAVHSDKLVPFFRAWAEELKKDPARSDEVKNIEQTIAELEKPGTLDTLERVIDHSTVDLWIDRNRSLLRQVQWTLTIVPPDGNEKLKDKQFELQLGVLLEKVNEKVTIDKPSGAISYDEAERLLTGISVEAQKFQKQISRITSVRSALSEYKRYAGTYPESIISLNDEIKRLRDECLAKEKEQPKNNNVNGFVLENISGCSLGLGSRTNTLSVTDVYTENPYGYAKDGEDYKLTYQLKFADDIESYSKDSYVDGQNTATSKDVSVEKVTDYEKITANIDAVEATPTRADSDLDGLSNEEEAIYKTNPNLVDTDGDGLTDFQEVKSYKTNPMVADTDGDTFPDGQEIQGGYDPNGPGKLAVALGAWTSCVSLDTVKTCSAYCQSIGKLCQDNGVTSRGYPSRGAEAWLSSATCANSAQVVGAGQKNCADVTDGGGARWKCFCV
jgi:hypothetical protein